MAIFTERDFSAREILRRVTHIYKVDQAIEGPKRKAARQKKAELKDPYLRIEREVVQRFRSDDYSIGDADLDMSRLLRACDTPERAHRLHQLLPLFYENVLGKMFVNVIEEIVSR